VKRKIPSPRRELNPNHPARSQWLYRLSYSGCLRVYIVNFLNTERTEVTTEHVELLTFLEIANMHIAIKNE
jgi:hypothetical protein